MVSELQANNTKYFTEILHEMPLHFYKWVIFKNLQFAALFGRLIEHFYYVFCFCSLVFNTFK